MAIHGGGPLSRFSRTAGRGRDLARAAAELTDRKRAAVIAKKRPAAAETPAFGVHPEARAVSKIGIDRVRGV